MPAWPATLPQQPVLNSPEVGAPVKAIIRSEMDTGPAKTRARVTAAVRPLSMIFFPLTDAQVVIFEEWHRSEIAMGALAFDISHPVTDAPIRARFATVDGQYTIRVRGRNANALSLRLEILP